MIREHFRIDFSHYDSDMFTYCTAIFLPIQLTNSNALGKLTIRDLNSRLISFKFIKRSKVAKFGRRLYLQFPFVVSRAMRRTDSIASLKHLLAAGALVPRRV